MIEKLTKDGFKYESLVDRNLGFINEEQQNKLRDSKIALFGLGGLGGPIFEILVRCGISNFSIVDNDEFEYTNMNRQNFANVNTVGKRKIDVANDWAKTINPEIEIEKFLDVDQNNIEKILKKSEVAVLAIDDLKPCLIVSRTAKKIKIPLVEGWAIPYGNVRVFTDQTVTLEESYGLPTANRLISEISEQEVKKLNSDIILGLGEIKGISDFYNQDSIKKIKEGHLPSFAPIVWLTSVLMAMETIKVILDWGKISLAPEFTLYDPFKHEIP